MHPVSVEKCKSPVMYSIRDLKAAVEHYLPDGWYRLLILRKLVQIEELTAENFDELKNPPAEYYPIYDPRDL